MTVDVPPTVRKGQNFKVVVRQITNAFATVPEPQTPPGIALVAEAAAVSDFIEWRRIIGSFQVSIPVQTKEALLEPEERLLSVLRWIVDSIPHDNRWYPVFRRYLEQTAGRVNALGGDATRIGPSSSGDWKAGARCRTWGRVTAIVLGALAASLGALTGTALTIVPPLLAVLLVYVAAVWSNKCHPKVCQWLQTFMVGVGLGAVLLAFLSLVGIVAPQLTPFLGGLILLLAAAFLIGRVKTCF
jgi:hypothetical protein